MKALSNDQMKAGRYLRWHQARVLHGRNPFDRFEVDEEVIRELEREMGDD